MDCSLVTCPRPGGPVTDREGLSCHHGGYCRYYRRCLINTTAITEEGVLATLATVATIEGTAGTVATIEVNSCVDTT